MMNPNHFIRHFSFVVGALGGLQLSGCAKVPEAAPTVPEMIYSIESAKPSDGFIYVNVDDSVVGAVARHARYGFGPGFASRPGAADLRVQIGDSLQILVFDVGGGLFGQTQAQAVLGGGNVGTQATSLLPVTVDRGGDITVPFADRIHVLGQTPEEIRATVERLLAAKGGTIKVQVQLIPAAANTVSVEGDVSKPSLVPLTLNGTKMLAAIANAGGAKSPPYEENIHLTRRGRTAVVLLQTLLDDPRQDVYLQPGDTVYLTHDPRMFTVFGAEDHPGEYSFDRGLVTLAEAVAHGGGLSDKVADPSGAYLLRVEPEDLARELKPSLRNDISGPIRVVYHIDLRQAQGYFFANHIALRDRDMVLVSDAEGVQWNKFFTLARNGVGLVEDVVSVGKASSVSVTSGSF